MSSEAQSLGFLNLYLSPFVNQKALDLIKLQVLKKFRKEKGHDLLLAEVSLVREILHILRKRRKGILAQPDLHHLVDPGLIEIIKLAPEDALLLCADQAFPIPLPVLSLAMHTPEGSLKHRQSQLLAQFGERVPTRNGRMESPRKDSMLRRGPFTTFQTLPLGIRFLIETTLVLVCLLGLLWVIPEVRNRYESSIQKRINEYLIESALVDAPAPEGTSKTPKIPAPEESSLLEEEGVNKSSSDAPSPKRQPKVNEGETWRFSFTGSATNEIESLVLGSLKRMNQEGQKPLSVPGGIQFDFILPVDGLLDFKNHLETGVSEVQRKANSAQTNTLAYANMSWYKKKNMGTRKIPSGHVQVIVWISTL